MFLNGKTYEESGVLVASGGIDSTSLMYLLAHAGLLETVMFFDYGQASADHQAGLLGEHTEKLHLELIRQVVPWPSWARGKGYIFQPGSRPDHPKDPFAPLLMNEQEFDSYLENSWDFIQGRNVVFLALACARAISEGKEVVYTGFQFDGPEWAGMGSLGMSGTDTSPAFAGAFNDMAALGGFSKPVEVVSPFLDLKMDKEAIIRAALGVGADLTKTHSCEFFPPCGLCHQCTIRAQQFEKHGITEGLRTNRGVGDFDCQLQRRQS